MRVRQGRWACSCVVCVSACSNLQQSEPRLYEEGEREAWIARCHEEIPEDVLNRSNLLTEALKTDILLALLRPEDYPPAGPGKKAKKHSFYNHTKSYALVKQNGVPVLVRKKDLQEVLDQDGNNNGFSAASVANAKRLVTDEEYVQEIAE